MTEGRKTEGWTEGERAMREEAEVWPYLRQPQVDGDGLGDVEEAALLV